MILVISLGWRMRTFTPKHYFRGRNRYYKRFLGRDGTDSLLHSAREPIILLHQQRSGGCFCSRITRAAFKSSSHQSELLASSLSPLCCCYLCPHARLCEVKGIECRRAWQLGSLCRSVGDWWLNWWMLLASTSAFYLSLAASPPFKLD